MQRTVVSKPTQGLREASTWKLQLPGADTAPLPDRGRRLQAGPWHSASWQPRQLSGQHLPATHLSSRRSATSCLGAGPESCIALHCIAPKKTNSSSAPAPSTADAASPHRACCRCRPCQPASNTCQRRYQHPGASRCIWGGAGLRRRPCSSQGRGGEWQPSRPMHMPLAHNVAGLGGAGPDECPPHRTHRAATQGCWRTEQTGRADGQIAPVGMGEAGDPGAAQVRPRLLSKVPRAARLPPPTLICSRRGAGAPAERPRPVEEAARARAAALLQAQPLDSLPQSCTACTAPGPQHAQHSPPSPRTRSCPLAPCSQQRPPTGIHVAPQSSGLRAVHGTARAAPGWVGRGQHAQAGRGAQAAAGAAKPTPGSAARRRHVRDLGGWTELGITCPTHPLFGGVARRRAAVSRMVGWGVCGGGPDPALSTKHGVPGATQSCCTQGCCSHALGSHHHHVGKPELPAPPGQPAAAGLTGGEQHARVYEGPVALCVVDDFVHSHEIVTAAGDRWSLGPGSTHAGTGEPGGPPCAHHAESAAARPPAAHPLLTGLVARVHHSQ